MSAVLSFALFVLVVVILGALITQIAYKLGRITRSEARFRQIFILSACMLSIIFVIIAAFFHISILFVLLGFFLLIMVIAAIVYVVFRKKQ